MVIKSDCITAKFTKTKSGMKKEDFFKKYEELSRRTRGV